LCRGFQSRSILQFIEEDGTIAICVIAAELLVFWGIPLNENNMIAGIFDQIIGIAQVFSVPCAEFDTPLVEGRRISSALAITPSSPVREYTLL
jgi:hypothetical protein